jgi:hypothetical protein
MDVRLTILSKRSALARDRGKRALVLTSHERFSSVATHTSTSSAGEVRAREA